VQVGNLTEVTMAHYIAIIEDAGPDHAAPKVVEDIKGNLVALTEMAGRPRGRSQSNPIAERCARSYLKPPVIVLPESGPKC
jgi:hypothetical protein